MTRALETSSGELATTPAGGDAIFIEGQPPYPAPFLDLRAGRTNETWVPFGATVDDTARRLGMLEVLWSVDSRDSLGASWREVIRNVEVGMRPGAILLMHENRGQTLRALPTVLATLRRHHLRSVSLPELLATDPPSVAQLREGERAVLDIYRASGFVERARERITADPNDHGQSCEPGGFLLPVIEELHQSCEYHLRNECCNDCIGTPVCSQTKDQSPPVMP